MTRRAPFAERTAILASLVAIGFVAWSIAHGTLGTRFEGLVAHLQRSVLAIAGIDTALGGPRLYAFAFIGGLAASLSPCILGMLPVNLAYIGAAKAPTRIAALSLASQFVAGVIVVTVVVGLFASLFFSLFVTYRGEINIAVGALTVVMALWLAGIVRLPFRAIGTMPTRGGPFVVGLVFALVASPCASPILVAVLGKAAASGVPFQAAFAMLVYAIGYTLVLWLASLFAGVAMASRKVLAHGELVTRIAATAMFVLGIGTAVYGFSQL